MEQHKSTYENILNTPLTPESINNYASNALNGVAGLVQVVREDYSVNVYGVYMDTAHLEEDALRANGIQGVNVILDHLMEKQEEIDNLENLITERIEKVEKVLVPTGSGRIPAGSGEGLSEKSIIPRLKTVLFLLSNEFGVDIYDNTAARITEGVVNSLVRDNSYFMIEVKHVSSDEADDTSLNKTILVCDEEGNVSYVFDQEILDEHGISAEDLSSFSKSELNELLRIFGEDGNPVGQRIAYSKSFVERFNGAMRGMYSNAPISALSSDLEATESSYLRPPLPVANQENGVMSVNGVASVLGVAKETITKIVRELKIYPSTYIFSDKNGREGKTGLGFTPSDLELIGQHDYFSIPVANTENGVVSIGSLRNLLRSGEKTLIKYAEEIGVQPKEYRFMTERGRLSTRGLGLTPEEVSALKQHPYFQIPIVEVGEVGVFKADSVAKRYDTRTQKIMECAKDLGLDGTRYRFTNSRGRVGPPTICYTAEEVMFISSHPFLNIPVATKESGIVSRSKLEDELMVKRETIQKCAEEMGVEGKKYIYYDKNGFKTAPGIGYTPAQLEIIMRHELFSLPIATPESGVMSASDVGTLFASSANTVVKYAKELGIEGREYRVVDKNGKKSQTAVHYSPDEVEALKAHPYFSLPIATPESGVTSVSDIGVLLGSSANTVVKYAKELGIEGAKYRLIDKNGRARKVGLAYSHEEVEALKAHPYFNLPVAEDDILALIDVAKLLGVNSQTAKKYASGAGLAHTTYRFADKNGKLNTLAVGYTSKQLDKIREQMKK